MWLCVWLKCKGVTVVWSCYFNIPLFFQHMDLMKTMWCSDVDVMWLWLGKKNSMAVWVWIHDSPSVARMWDSGVAKTVKRDAMCDSRISLVLYWCYSVALVMWLWLGKKNVPAVRVWRVCGTVVRVWLLRGMYFGKIPMTLHQCDICTETVWHVFSFSLARCGSLRWGSGRQPRHSGHSRGDHRFIVHWF